MGIESPDQVEVLQSRLEQVEQALAVQLQERATEAAARRTQRRRLLAVLVALVVVTVPFIAREALSAGCPRTGSFIYLTGLQYFCAEDPARADEVNANTQVLVTAIEQKVGQLGNSTIPVGLVRGSGFDGCYFSTCPAGTAPLFANVTCPAGVRVGNSNAMTNNRWYVDCGSGAACTTFVDVWCSRVLR